MKVAATALTLVGAAAVVLAPPASADKFDFINELDNQGITYDSISDMIDTGKAICHAIRDGDSLGAVNSALARKGWYSSQERGIIIVAAANHMCPDIWPALRAQVRQPEGAPPAAGGGEY